MAVDYCCTLKYLSKPAQNDILISRSSTSNSVELWLAVEWDNENGAIPQKKVIDAADVSEGGKVQVKCRKKIFDCIVLKKGN